MDKKLDMNNYYDTKIHWIELISIPEYAFILLAWKRRSGKTVLCRNLLKKICDDFDISFIIIFSKTAKYTWDYDFIKNNHVYDYDEETDKKIQKIMNYQEKNIKKKQKTKGIILFDDIILHKKNNEISNLAWYARHLNLFVILSCQHAKWVVWTIIRNNLDLIFFNDLTYSNEMAIYEWIHIPFKYKEFHAFIDEHNWNYTFIMYDNSQTKKNRIMLVKSEIFETIEIEFEK